MSLEVAKADKTPLEEDSDYQKAFTQVPGHCCYSLWKHHLYTVRQLTCVLQITNLWAVNKQVEEFVLGHKLGQIASELMGVSAPYLNAVH